MRKTIGILLISLSGLSLHAQTNLDSLWGIWQDEGRPDTARIIALKNYSWNGYMFSEPDSALYFSQLFYELAERKGLKRYMADAISAQGVAHSVKSDYRRALDHFMRAMVITEELQDRSGTASGLNNIGLTFERLADYPKALAYYERSLKIRTELGDTALMTGPLTNIANIYADMKEYAKAEVYYNRSLQISEETGDQQMIAGSLANLGIISDEQGEYGKAMEYFRRSLTVWEDLGEKFGIANTHITLGECYWNQHDLPQALVNYQKSLSIFNEIGDKHGVSSALSKIGKVYGEQGSHARAIAECLEALEQAQHIESIRVQIDACDCLYGAYKAMGNGSKALEYHEQLLALNDSMQTEETMKKLEQMEFAKQMFADSVARAEETRLTEAAHREEIRKKNQTRNLSLAGAFGFYSRWRFVRRSRDEIAKEKDRSENLLLNILPAEVAEELKAKGRAEARDYDMVSILFTDFVTFTETSEKLSAAELVDEINTCFEAFDRILEKHRIEKIKTIGDAYMAAGGLPIPDDASAKNTVMAALDMQDFIRARKAERDAAGLPAFQMRAGIHTGPVVAGIVGVKKFQYDIWGDTVNTASRMENAGEAGRVNISKSTYDQLNAEPGLTFKNRGRIDVKGKGEVDMFFVERKSDF